MTTLNATGTRRAITRLTGPDSLPARCAGAARYHWLRLSLPLPAVADSRTERAVLSTSVRADWLGALDVLGLVAAAGGAVALLSALCR